MTQSAHPERVAGPSASLDERILLAEQAVVRRDERVREALQATLARSRGAVARQRDRIGVGLAAVAALAALALVARTLLRRRHRPAVPDLPPHGRWHGGHARHDGHDGHDGHGHGGLGGLGKLLVLAAPLLPASLQRWVPASGRFTAAGLLLPALPLLRQALPGLTAGAAFGPPPPTVATLDLQRYAGDWHEIARFPTVVESTCARDATAHYTPLDSGEVAVVNACRSEHGREQRVRGVATVVPGSGNAKLKVTFAPAWLRWIPFVWADYWVLHVDAGYRHALVGTPDRRHLWLLARSPAPQRAVLADLIGRALAAGYDVERLQRTPQSGA